MSVDNQCTVVVSSFDGFCDCWSYFSYGINKYWPNCPWPIVLLTCRKTPQYPQISALPLHQDHGWAGNMIEALKNIPSPYVLYMQEDYWIDQPVDTALLKSYLAQMTEKNGFISA